MLTDFVVYSRFIFFSKILLGFASVVIFIGIFFYSSSNNVQNSVTVISRDVKVGVKYQAYNARIKGFTTDGSSFDFRAKSLDPSKKDINIVIISKPKGLVLFPNKEKVNFSADFAIFNIINKNLSFKGKVILTDSQGNFINTEELYILLESDKFIFLHFNNNSMCDLKILFHNLSNKTNKDNCNNYP